MTDQVTDQVADYVVPKPATARGYALHRMAEGLTGGARPLFADFGDHMVLRTESPIEATQRPLRQVAEGDIIGFELRACVGTKVKGRHRYFRLSDWRSRHEWLERQGRRHGFEVITVHCSASMARVEKPQEVFTIDQTDFTGVLKVTDGNKFQQALSQGVGSTARAFGFGMINI